MASVLIDELESLVDQLDETPGASSLFEQCTTKMQQIVHCDPTQFSVQVPQMETLLRRLLHHRQMLINSVLRRVQQEQSAQQAQQDQQHFMAREK